jgi:hypothetical protein
MNGTREIGHNDMFKVNLVIHRELILKRGIRKPDQILEDMRKPIPKHLNGITEGDKKTEEDHDFYNDTLPSSVLYPEKRSINL